MSGRTGTAVKAVLAGVMMGLAAGGAAGAAGVAARPNILLILSDDHSAPYLGCYGYKGLPTPNLDRFAAEGMRFTNAFTAAPQCVQSRVSLLTGRSPAAARVGRFSSALPADVPSLIDLLRAEGYYTGVCRRQFHLDGWGRPGGLIWKMLQEMGMQTFKNGRVDYYDYNSPQGQTAAKMNDFLGRVPGGKPFFLWVNFNDPHHPWDPSAQRPALKPGDMTAPGYLPDLPGVRSDLAAYCGEIARMDEEFQRVMDILAQRGLAENTIVVFMGDNGMAFPHGKGSLYDPGLHVPLMVRWPGAVQAGTTAEELISGEDLTPTLLEAAGLTAPKEMSGVSFAKLLRGEAFTGRRCVFAMRGPHGDAVFEETTPSSGYDLGRCVRTRRYKLIINYTPWQRYEPTDSAKEAGWVEMTEAHRAGKLGADFEKAYFTCPRPIVELYDLEKDPWELHNRAGQAEYAQAERELKMELQRKMMLDYDFLPLPLAQ